MGLGRADEALALSGDVLARDAVPRPFLAAEHAENLAAGGRGVEAVALLTDAIADKRLDRERNADQLASLSRTLRLLAPPPHDARVTCTLWSAQLRISTANPSVPPPPSPVPTGCPGAAATVTALPTPSR